MKEIKNATDVRTGKFHSIVQCDDRMERFFELTEVSEEKSIDRGKEVEEKIDALKKAKEPVKEEKEVSKK